MTSTLTDENIEHALQTCADEPVHIPGTVQPFGCLIAVDFDEGDIQYVSGNSMEVMGVEARSLLGKHLRDVIGSGIWHGLRNAMAQSDIANRSISIGQFEIAGTPMELGAFKTGKHLVIEIEAVGEATFEDADSMQTLTFLMARIQNCEDQQSLFDLTVDLMRHLSGYDRALIYCFDPEFNGQVLAESRRGSLDSMLGLRFPSFDIPAQARAIMAKVRLRFIQDVDQVPCPLLAASETAPPLDITLAAARGVSPVHMQYLRNMGTRATLTLSVMLDDQLWGIISFHHGAPKVPAPALRKVLTSFVSVFSGKLHALRQKATLERISKLDKGLMNQDNIDLHSDSLVPTIAPIVLDVMEADGMATFSGAEADVAGSVPEYDVLQQLQSLALEHKGVVAIDSLVERFPALGGKLKKSAGALLVGGVPDRAICIFRDETAQQIAWAGNPEKTIEQVSGQFRLSPRGSFSTYLENVAGRSQAWTSEDIDLIRHIRTLLHAAERQSMMERLNRQQSLMIGELNHRVRNILALVRSVSRQARRRYGSLNSYANAIENRIRALAAAHDISGGSSSSPVSITDLIRIEFEPFRAASEQQPAIFGQDKYLRPEIAPIFSLVLHELATNAAKYGALSVPEGKLDITLTHLSDGLQIDWIERGGPPVMTPNEIGFGMAMIRQAVPHELGGTAEVTFDPDGLVAQFFLPEHHFSDEEGTLAHTRQPLDTSSLIATSELLITGSAMVLEDNFIIAREMSDQLEDFGFDDVETFGTPDDALGWLEQETPTFAVLDVNLGQDRTSETVALTLHARGIPFMFVTGYGEGVELSPELRSVPRLTKPISTDELRVELAKLLAPENQDDLTV